LIDSKGDSIKVEDALPIFDFLLYKPQLSQKRVLIINDCEKVNLTVQSSLLKILEEPKDHFLIILISTNPHKLLKTIKSRVIPLRFTKPNKSELINFIELNHPTKAKDLEHLITLSQNHTAKAIEYLNNNDSLKSREKNIQMFQRIMGNNFIEQSDIIKNLIAEFEALEKEFPDKNLGIKTFLKTLIND
jgi:DNA polymerase III subunit delta'